MTPSRRELDGSLGERLRETSVGASHSRPRARDRQRAVEAGAQVPVECSPGRAAEHAARRSPRTASPLARRRARRARRAVSSRPAAGLPIGGPCSNGSPEACEQVAHGRRRAGKLVQLEHPLLGDDSTASCHQLRDRGEGIRVVSRPWVATLPRGRRPARPPPSGPPGAGHPRAAIQPSDGAPPRLGHSP